MIEFDVIFKTPFFEVEESQNIFNESGSYYRISCLPSAIICLVSESDEIILINQFRPNLNCNTIEFPAGYIEKDESPTEAARREVLEETGMECDLLYLGKSRLLMNRYFNHEYLFIGLLKNDEKKTLNNDLLSVCKEDFMDLIIQEKFEQLAALGLINLLYLKFDIDFFKTKELYKQIKEKIYENKKN